MNNPTVSSTLESEGTQISRANTVLLAVAVLYPIGSLILLRCTSGITGIPDTSQWVFFSFVLPAIGAVSAIVAKLRGAQVSWTKMAAFVPWLAFVGWFQHWLITTMWAVI